jgi:cation transport regulator ChaC
MERTRLMALGAMFLSVLPASARDWQGVMLPKQPSEFIFGYGSLINSASRNATVGKMIPAIPVRVSAAFGYIRAWGDRSSSGFTALGLRKPGENEKASTINGVLYPVEAGDMTKYDLREQNYGRVEVPRDDIEAVSWQQLPATGRIWVYVPLKAEGQSGVGPPAASAEFPLLESYIDVVVEGALEYGETFAHELLETTSDWSNYWLIDRELARRPWVYNPASSEVDQLLLGTPEPAAKLRFRLFPESYAIHWAEEKAQEGRER